MTLAKKVKKLEAEVAQLKEQLLALSLCPSVIMISAPLVSVPSIPYYPQPNLPYIGDPIYPFQNPTITYGGLNMSATSQSLL